MARQWKVWDNWDAGGFFAGGSRQGRGRFNSLNLQRYQNGSIGPRPGWRKLTQSDFGSSPDSVPSVASASRSTLQQGAFHAPWGDYIVLIGSGSSGPSKRINISGADGTAIYRDAADLGYHATSASNIKNIYSALQVNAVEAVIENNGYVFVGGSNTYETSTDTLGTVTARTISASAFYPTNVVFYKGRLYGWEPINVLNLENVVYSSSSSIIDFNGGDSGAFTLAGTTVGGNATYIPHGMWALGSGLLIFAHGGASTASPGGYTGFTSQINEHGRWFMLTGPSPATGTLTPLDRDIGPLYHSLSIVHDGKLLFPINRQGWAVHDGVRVDKTTLADLKPGRGQFVKNSLWLNPVRVVRKNGLVLPWYIYESDPTAPNQSSTVDQIGEFWSYGLGAFEFSRNAWTEQLYLHGQSDIVAFGAYQEDKLFSIHLDSSDGGTNYFPQIYTRDLTLDRPATTSSQNTYNPYSDGDETLLTQHGGTESIPEAFLETDEFQLDGYSAFEPMAIVIDYDYWNSSLFHGATCGFEVELVVRSVTNQEKTVHTVTTAPITPPATSEGVIPNRARAVLNLGARPRDCGTVQVRIINIVDCAFHSVALNYDGPSPSESVR